MGSTGTVHSAGCRAACSLSAEHRGSLFAQKLPLAHRTAVKKYYSTGGFTRGQQKRGWRYKGKCLWNVGMKACRMQGRILAGYRHRHATTRAKTRLRHGHELGVPQTAARGTFPAPNAIRHPESPIDSTQHNTACSPPKEALWQLLAKTNGHYPTVP